MKVGSAGRAQGAQANLLRETVAACAVLAAIAALAGGVSGHLSVGAGLGVGLIIGSFNGHLVVAVLERDAPFVVASVARLALVSAVAIMTALLLGSAGWSVLIGVGAAQLVMVAAGVRQGLRA